MKADEIIKNQESRADGIGESRGNVNIKIKRLIRY